MKKSSTPSQVGPLFLVGLGLCDENDVSNRAIEVLRTCTTVFAESYTNLMREGTLRRLEERIGRKIILLAREEVEGEKKILEACASGPTALVVPGDPMTATTHNSVQKEGNTNEYFAFLLDFHCCPRRCWFADLQDGKDGHHHILEEELRTRIIFRYHRRKLRKRRAYIMPLGHRPGSRPHEAITRTRIDGESQNKEQLECHLGIHSHLHSLACRLGRPENLGG